MITMDTDKITAKDRVFLAAIIAAGMARGMDFSDASIKRAVSIADDIVAECNKSAHSADSAANRTLKNGRE